jgi:hypothetical protein
MMIELTELPNEEKITISEVKRLDFGFIYCSDHFRIDDRIKRR